MAIYVINPDSITVKYYPSGLDRDKKVRDAFLAKALQSYISRIM